MADIIHKKLLNTNQFLFAILALAVIVHGSMMVFSHSLTYDFYVHTFLADHYARSWFEPWEERWYTGFTTTSYPPLIHQLGALLSYIVGLKTAMILVFLIALLVLIAGIFRFSKLFVSANSALMAASFGIFAPSVIEAVHIFGQIPTIAGIGFLLHGTTEIYKWFLGRKNFNLIAALSFFSVTVAAHHVTTIFGLVFFVAPVVLMALYDRCGFEKISLNKDFFQKFMTEIWDNKFRIGGFIFAFISLLLIIVFPYWLLSKTDPITQVPIPHGSRDNFIINKNSGIIFFFVPWGISLVIIPFILKTILSKRNIFIGLSISLLFILGTGGTTPIPKLLLGENAFNILTLDRFTFWASIMILPFIGQFITSFLKGDLAKKLKEKLGLFLSNTLRGIFVAYIALQAVLVFSIIQLKPSQPDKINVNPIVNFLKMDDHDKWRFLTLGFGDQMAWLSANTNAKSIDGNYHSARRVPELTTRAVERLENAKYQGFEGLGSLQQLLTVAEKYHLKYIFSNDKFYDPLLYYTGWHRVQRLENGIMVWEKNDIKPLPPVLPKKNIPTYQKIIWGILPVSTVLLLFLINVFLRIKKKKEKLFIPRQATSKFSSNLVLPTILTIIPIIILWWCIKDRLIPILHPSPESTVLEYYKAIDNKQYQAAHNHFDPRNRPSFNQYTLETSVIDGLMSSYAKLDNVSTELIEKNDSIAIVKTTTDWISPLKLIHQENEHTLFKVKNKWYLETPRYDISIPPDRFFSTPAIRYFNQGKRRVSTTPTIAEDVMDRPELQILSARVVKRDSVYSVVGEILNIDNYPAHITITAELIDKEGLPITAYNARFGTNHKIVPKEITPFRIDFERTAFMDFEDKRSSKLNPTEFRPYLFNEVPVDCKIYSKAVVEKRDLNKRNNIINTSIIKEGKDTSIQGELLNTGVDEITIPQLISTYYDNKCEVKWVDYQFITKSIRPQRETAFEIKTDKLSNLEILFDIKEEYKYVNGLSQSSFNGERKKYNCPESIFQISPEHQIKLDINSFIGLPTIY